LQHMGGDLLCHRLSGVYMIEGVAPEPSRIHEAINQKR
jgi:hypothetical protein